MLEQGWQRCANAKKASYRWPTGHRLELSLLGDRGGSLRPACRGQGERGPYERFAPIRGLTRRCSPGPAERIRGSGPGRSPGISGAEQDELVVFGAIFVLSVGFALFLVLRREFHGLLLETPAEFAFWGRGPVLGVTPSPDNPRGLDELVAGLDDFVPHVRGSLLIPRRVQRRGPTRHGARASDERRLVPCARSR